MAIELGIRDAVTFAIQTNRNDCHFRALAESIPQIVWLATALGCVSYQNRRWYEYTGLSAEDSTGFGWK